jgi:CRISPR/Cas system Type II protein with McrA/HNH and RuvC-like nuclease domain
MEQTAVEYLYEALWEAGKDKFMWQIILQQAKEMEKEQIKEAYKFGAGDLEIQYSDVGEINSEQYYNETYRKDA